jgi:hypothetical protein
MEPNISPIIIDAFQFNKDDFIKKNRALLIYYNKDATFKEFEEKCAAIDKAAVTFNTAYNTSRFHVNYKYDFDIPLDNKIVDHGYSPYLDVELAFLLYCKIMSKHIGQISTNAFDKIDVNDSTRKTTSRLASNRIGVSFQFSIEDFMNKNPALKLYENFEATFKEIYDMFIMAGYNGDRVVGMIDEKIIDKGYPPYPNAVFAFLLYYHIMENSIEILQYVKDD